METYTCQYCGKQCKNQNSLRNHERLCKQNPDRQHIEQWTHNEKWNEKAGKGHPGSNQFIKARKLGLPMPEGTMKGRSSPCRGRKHTEEEKRRISETQKRNFKENGAVSIWHTQLENRRSYAEQYFLQIFTDAVFNHHVDRYFLDFAWLDKKVYVEVDGEQHYNDRRVIEHDIEREKILAALGWVCVCRIRWATFIRLSKDAREEFVKGLQARIEAYNNI